MQVIITNHSEKRIKERTGLSKKQSDKLALNALEHGITHREAKGNLKKYLDKLFLSHGKANNMRVYNQKVFLFDRNTLITVINLPTNLVKIANDINKKKENLKESLEESPKDNQ